MYMYMCNVLEYVVVLLVGPLRGGTCKDPKNKTARAPSWQPRPPSPGVKRVLAPATLVLFPAIAYSPINHVHVSNSQLSPDTKSDSRSPLTQIYPSTC